MNARRLLVLGLDSATFDVVLPLVAEGRMPFFGRLLREGAWGCLESTFPPVTPPAWIGMATGMGPGRLGTFDFLVRQGRAFRPLTSSSFAGRAYWDLLGRTGQRVVVVNHPMLYPVPPVAGLAVSGVGAPEGGVLAWPPGLQRRLDAVCDGYELLAAPSRGRYVRNRGMFCRDLLRVFQKRCRALEELVTTEPWDLFVGVLSETDFLQHALWSDWDPTHPLHDPEESAPYARFFRRFWTRVDRFAERLWGLCPPGTRLLVLSDHGAGPATRKFRVNRWLEQEGFLVRRPGARQSAAGRVKRLLDAHLPWAEPVLSWLRGRLGLSHADSVMDWLDWDRTTAFAGLHNEVFGGIYVAPFDGPSSPAREARIDAVLERLSGLRDDRGARVPVKAMRGRDAFPGPRSSEGPDVVVVVDDYRCGVCPWEMEGATIEEGPFARNLSGLHRPEGILIAAGEDIRPGRIHGAKVADVCPTVLALQGARIPEGLDGRTLEEIVGHPSAGRAPGDAPEPVRTAAELSDEDQEAIAQSLRDLGYLG